MSFLKIAYDLTEAAAEEIDRAAHGIEAPGNGGAITIKGDPYAHNSDAMGADSGKLHEAEGRLRAEKASEAAAREKYWDRYTRDYFDANGHSSTSEYVQHKLQNLGEDLSEGFGKLKGYLGDKASALTGWLNNKHMALEDLISAHPNAAMAAAGGAGAAGAGGIVGALLNKSKRKSEAALGGELRRLSGRNKKLALLAALGIPAAAGAAYLATRDKKRSR